MKFVAHNHMNNVPSPFIEMDARRDLFLPSSVRALANGLVIVTLSKLWQGDQKLIAFDILDKFFQAEFGKGFEAAIMGNSDCSHVEDISAFFEGTKHSGAKPIAPLSSRILARDGDELTQRFGCVALPERRDDLLAGVLGVSETDTLPETEAQRLGAFAERLEDFIEAQHVQADARRNRQPHNYRLAI